jgi:hypothetical protein
MPGEPSALHPEDERRSLPSRAARAFIARVRRLTLEELGTAIRRWHNRMDGPDAASWFAAEDAVAHVIDAHDLHAAQEQFLRELADVFVRERPWFRRSTPGSQIHASEASAQYLVTLVTLALVAKPFLPQHQVSLLYAPFEPTIPFTSLLPQDGDHTL